MPTSRLPTTACQLEPQQTRVLHAQGGQQLEVLAGRLWVTEPGAEQDRFLCAGQRVTLTQNWVVVQADTQPSASGASAGATYVLRPSPCRALASLLNRWRNWRLTLQAGPQLRLSATPAPANPAP